MTKIVAISDTHGLHLNLNPISGDILIHAGDMRITSEASLYEMNCWFGSLNFKHVICIAGNHDTFLEKIGPATSKELFTNAHYLHNEAIELMGKTFYGSPYSPMFNNWSFMYERGSIELKNNWELVPQNLDFLITHCPPYGILDRNLHDVRCGCEILQREITKKSPLVHIFGHIHLSGGQSVSDGGSQFYNVSVLNEEYKLSNRPTILEVNDE